MLVKIYQTKPGTGYSFMPYEFAKKHGFSLNDYKEVYSYILIPDTKKILLSDEDVKGILDLTIWPEFNLERPEDFKGHSLSVSDIVSLDGILWYCDNYGWEKVEEEF